MHDILRALRLSSAVNRTNTLAPSSLHLHPRSSVLHRTTRFHRSIGSAVMAEKPLQMLQPKAIHPREHFHGNGYIATCAHVAEAHLMAVC
ncbi:MULTISPECIES: hypothetical protein [Stenotrophomonas]|uniref:hypothetical protein n=1 Tax=Stenotrophomonas TaxID=40323 RepID=UPI00131EEB4C|nr:MULTISPECIES: hypothetical protein [Stenotrophomonas]